MSKYVCRECGSEDIQVKMWANPNTNEIDELCDDEFPECWCNQCQEITGWRKEE